MICQSLSGQTPEAERAFTAAIKSFQDGFYDRAESEFSRFAASYPDSAKTAEAILRQAQCRFFLKRYDEAADLLRSRIKQAGPLADLYEYWQAESEFNQQNFNKAVQLYADVLKNYSKSTIRLEAGYGEAFSYFKLRKYPEAIQLLQDPNGAFQQAIKTSTNSLLVVQGQLLLGEALFSNQSYAAAETTLKDLANRTPNAETEWQRLYLLTSIALAAQRTDDALQRATNLVNLATQIPSKPVYQGNSLMLQAEILRQRNDTESVIQTYTKIAEINGLPATQSRQALMKIAEVAVSLNRFTNAIEQIQNFINKNPQDSSVDVLRLSCGELYMRQFYSQFGQTPKLDGPANLPIATNLLQQARSQFDIIIKGLTNSPLLGKAFLDMGWCFWEEAQFTGNPARVIESQSAFQIAVDKLPKSDDQAIARFKWADCQFQQKDYTNAIGNYRLLLQQYSDSTTVKERLFDQMLYQLVRACVEIHDLAGAKDALDKILGAFPKSPLSEKSLFLYGQALLNENRAEAARAAFADFGKRFPDSSLAPEVQLAVARSYVVEENWSNAIGEYQRWVNTHTNHPSFLQAEFDRAWVYSRANQETNALPIFTNIVDRFPQSSWAPLAQYWVADYYFRQRDSDSIAEEYYQKVFQSLEKKGKTNAAPNELGFQARLMAARAALRRSKPADAQVYLDPFVKDISASVPAPLVAQGLYLYGEAVAKSEPPATNKLMSFETAIVLFQRIVDRYPNDRLVPIAHGRIAECCFQLGSTNRVERYNQATNEYRAVLNSTLADVTTRSEAQVGLGKVIEELANFHPGDQAVWLNQALNQYLDVAYESNLRPGEKANPFWVAEAGIEAARLASKSLQKTDQAINILERLQISLPPLFQAGISNRLVNLRSSRGP